jgi:hypothetical protein
MGYMRFENVCCRSIDGELLESKDRRNVISESGAEFQEPWSTGG